MISSTFFVALALQASAAPLSNKLAQRGEVRPQVKQATVMANVTDPGVSRDSCGSSRVGDRLFWTCRDTSLFSVELNECTMPMVPTSASWTDVNVFTGISILASGPIGTASTGSNPIVQMYGTNAAALTPFFPIPEDMCPSDGMCGDGTRWVNWPDQPPAVAHALDDGSFVGYTWAPKGHLQDISALNPEPPHTLYRLFYLASEDKNAMPFVSVAADEFWAPGEIGYGRYGQVVKDGTMYLYGTAGSGIALAKVSVDTVELRNTYQYYVNGAWTFNMPNYNDTSAVIDNAGAGGQGTFYYSTYYDSYIWIGQAGIAAVADFMLTTAPSPEGPWIEPYQIYSGENGDSGLGGYSLQAHPGMLPSTDASENAIYLTWTQQWSTTTYPAGYVTPLLYVEFE